ncbi:hypothetical protein DPMN_127961 [Dreissena polymorpha]|uniref:Uncharacterized protein n=1 Tax=Dreissena polymorpha TaxID=45954 RepID=A0A9D4JVA9_DREPO|nr:hypothetical protein DPMN_127961 [Dreissena polymorpha]
MTSLDATSRRPELQKGFPSTLCVLSTAVLGHIHYLNRTTSPCLNLCPRSAPSYTLQPPLHGCSRHSSGYVVKQQSTNGQLPFRLAIRSLSSLSPRSKWDRTSGSRDDATRWISRAARRSSPIRPFSDDVVKPLSNYMHYFYAFDSLSKV